jgi:hypothetical protein
MVVPPHEMARQARLRLRTHKYGSAADSIMPPNHDESRRHSYQRRKPAQLQELGLLLVPLIARRENERNRYNEGKRDHTRHEDDEDSAS